MKIKTGILILLILAGPSLACVSKVQMQTPEPAPHAHYYPFTEVLGDYHLRLIVDHHKGEMVLAFEDFQERPVKPVQYKGIKGKVTFPDGTAKEVTFLAETEVATGTAAGIIAANTAFQDSGGSLVYRPNG